MKLRLLITTSVLLLLPFACSPLAAAQGVSKVLVADNADGMYKIQSCMPTIPTQARLFIPIRDEA